MALSKVQFETLFNGAFGAPLVTLGFEVDTSGPEPVARKGDHVVRLYEVNGRGIEWIVDGKTIAPFQINGSDEAGQKRKAANRIALEAALA